MPKGTKHSYFNEKGCAHKSTSFFYALSLGKKIPRLLLESKPGAKSYVQDISFSLKEPEPELEPVVPYRLPKADAIS